MTSPSAPTAPLPPLDAADAASTPLPDNSHRPRSAELHEAARRVIPGGVNSPARAFGAVGGAPVTIASGDRQYLTCVDGHRYLDLVGSWGPHILGHRHPAILSAISDAMDRGTSFGAPTERETELAELICSLVPSVEMVRMTNSGTEAVMSAVRVARGYTGRDVVVKFAGCYHGHVDALLVEAGSGALTLGMPSSPGVPEGATRDTALLEYNDPDAIRAFFAEHGDRAAAVILEPVVGNMGLVQPDLDWLRLLRELCTEHGTVLIFDEVMTGFRLSIGGAQQLFGITPDMTTMGKIVGGGLPVGAYGGRRDIMQCVSPVGGVYQAGTLSGNPLAVAAGIATLTTLRDENPYPRLDAISDRLSAAVVEAAARHGVPLELGRVGSMWTGFFNTEAVVSYAVSKRNDTESFATFFHAMLDRGVYLPCSQFEAAFTSACVTDDDVAHFTAAADEAMAAVAVRQDRRRSEATA